MVKYKLRIYKLTGSNAGRLSHEEFFASFEQAKARYYELFDYNLFSLNPTMWELCDNDEWIRIPVNKGREIYNTLDNTTYRL